MDGSLEEVYKKLEGRGDGDGRRVLVAGAIHAVHPWMRLLWWKSTVNR